MEIIYDKHEEEWGKCINDEEKAKVAATWMQEEETLDRWRHRRMLSQIKPLISKKTTWLTVGDGRYGTDAHYIIRQGGLAHATDISDKLLKIGSQTGFINSFSAENAENLRFADGSYDYVLIKEAFHHFPRPWIALYEAFRVCRKAVILIEPNDGVHGVRASITNKAKLIAKKLIKNNPSQYSFEPVGNFVYSLNSKELEKFLLGMHYRNIATKGLNDCYEKGVEFINLNTNSSKEQRIIKKVKSSIYIKDLLCAAGLLPYGLQIAALFKDNPTHQTKAELTQMGWKIKELPKNPYL